MVAEIGVAGQFHVASDVTQVPVETLQKGCVFFPGAPLRIPGRGTAGAKEEKSLVMILVPDGLEHSELSVFRRVTADAENLFVLIPGTGQRVEAGVLEEFGREPVVAFRSLRIPGPAVLPVADHNVLWKSLIEIA